MFNKLKYYLINFLIIVTWLALIYMLVTYFKEITNNSLAVNIQSAIEIFGYLFLIISFTYSNSNLIFLMWKRLIVFIANPSVNWRFTTIYNVDDIEKETYIEIFNALNDKYDNFSFPNSYNPKLSSYKITVNDISYHISVEFIDENYEIRITAHYRTSYRNSLKDLYSDYEQIEQIIRSNFYRPKNISYLLNIELDQFNPFYKIYLKHYEEIDNFNFKMSYDSGQSKVIISNNKISIGSNAIKNIKDISKNYIAISNSSLFN